MKHILAIAAVALIWVADAPLAQASKVIPYTNRQIIAAADLVASGEVTEIFPPPKTGEKDIGVSVARIKLDVVYKGPAKSGETIEIGYRSHGDENEFFPPDKYAAGEKLTVALHARATKPDASTLASANAPPEWAQAAWENHYRRSHDKQVQLAPFRQEAEIWNEPAAHLKDSELRRTAVYFLAAQGKLSDEDLIEQIRSDDPLDQLNGARSAEICKSHAALKPLVELFIRLREVKDGKRAYAESTYVDGPTLLAIEAIRYTDPEDAELIAKILPHFGRQFRLERVALQVLAVGKQRAALTKLLVNDRPDEPTSDEVRFLRLLDARAAWPLFRRMPESNVKTHLAGQEFKVCEDHEQLWSSLKQKHAVGRMEAFQPKSGQIIPLDKSETGQILEWLSQAKPAADPKGAANAQPVDKNSAQPAEKNPAPTEWLVDIYTNSSDVPSFQVWLTEDGSGGISCLPDDPPRAYPELLQMIRAANEKK